MKIMELVYRIMAIALYIFSVVLSVTGKVDEGIHFLQLGLLLMILAEVTKW